MLPDKIKEMKATQINANEATLEKKPGIVLMWGAKEKTSEKHKETVAATVCKPRKLLERDHNGSSLIPWGVRERENTTLE